MTVQILFNDPFIYIFIGKLSVGTICVGVCRFCGSTDNTGILAIGNVCAEPECQVSMDYFI